MSVSASSVQDNTFSFAKKTADAIKRAVGLDTPKKPEPQPAPPAEAIPAEKVNPVASANALAERCRLYLSSSDVNKIREAFRYADQAHLGQFRCCRSKRNC